MSRRDISISTGEIKPNKLSQTEGGTGRSSRKDGTESDGVTGGSEILAL